jgi:hypothetical protein
MDPWTTLHGHVLDADGKPAAKVHVELGPIHDKEALTAESGSFAFDKLAPGSYTLLAKPEPKVHTQEGVRVEAVPTYFPSTVESSQTERILVRGGVDLPDYEIRLRISPVYHVRGVVLNDAGKPSVNATVKLLRPPGQGTQGYGVMITSGAAVPLSIVTGPAVAKEETEVVSSQDGKFEFPSVPPGGWRLEAGADPVNDTVPDDLVVSSGGTWATVTGNDIEDLEIRLAAPFNLDYSVEWGEAKPPQDFRGMPQVLLKPLDGQPGPIIPKTESRRFEHVLPGRYRIVPPIFAQGFYVASVLLGGREVLGQEVDLVPGSPPLRIAYKAGLGSLGGTVEKGEGATVVLVSRPSPQESNGFTFIRTVRCGPGGAFDMGSVTPGDYNVVAFDRVESWPMEAPEFVSTIRSSSVSVRVEERATASVELRVTRWPW